MKLIAMIGLFAGYSDSLPVSGWHPPSEAPLNGVVDSMRDPQRMEDVPLVTQILQPAGRPLGHTRRQLKWEKEDGREYEKMKENMRE